MNIFYYKNILQKLPKLSKPYKEMTAQAKRSFSDKIVRATLPTYLDYGDSVSHDNFGFIYFLFHILQGYDVWTTEVQLCHLPMTRKYLRGYQHICLEDILPWASYEGSTKISRQPKENFKVHLKSYNMFLDIFNEVLIPIDYSQGPSFCCCLIYYYCQKLIYV